MSASNCVACEKLAPGVPSRLIIPSESKLFTVSPRLGTYVANRWSNDRFSPTMTITCLMGVTVLASPLGALLACLGVELTCPGVALKLATSKAAETHSRVTERVTWSTQALVELFCCFFIELFRSDDFEFR